MRKSKISKKSHCIYKYLNLECYRPLGMESGEIKACQISASSAVSRNYAPQFGRFKGQGYWAPALRFWDKPHYLQVDFLRKTRVTQVVVQHLRGTRKVLAYRLLCSNNLQTWSDVTDVSYFSYANGVGEDKVKTPCEARYYRLVIEEVSDVGRRNDWYIAVKAEFFGCYLDSRKVDSGKLYFINLYQNL